MCGQSSRQLVVAAACLTGYQTASRPRKLPRAACRDTWRAWVCVWCTLCLFALVCSCMLWRLPSTIFPLYSFLTFSSFSTQFPSLFRQGCFCLSLCCAGNGILLRFSLSYLLSITVTTVFFLLPAFCRFFHYFLRFCLLLSFSVHFSHFCERGILLVRLSI